MKARFPSVILVAMFLALPCFAQAQERLEFALEEVSAFDTSIPGRESFILGQRVQCAREAEGDVVKYPDFVSGDVLFGSVSFGVQKDPERKITYHFAIDESKGQGKGHEALCLDLNRDLDLSNDEPMGVVKEPPRGASPNWSGLKETVVFDYVTVAVAQEGEEPPLDWRVLPRLTVSESGYVSLAFVSPTLRRGEITIGKHEYEIVLGQAYAILGRYDKPHTYVSLMRRGGGVQERWWGANTLGAMRHSGGKWHRLSATPSGDRLFAEEYAGETGVFVAGAGGRDVENVTIQGSLSSGESSVPVGDLEKMTDWPTEAESMVLPVGDYRPTYLTVTLDNLRVQMSYNYHSEGKPRERGDRPDVYGISIRKDKPFVFDFSNEPVVMFSGLKALERFHPGDEVKVYAVLTDPVLDIMIRGLDDISSMQAGAAQARAVSLDPIVAIRDSEGLIVAEGKLPFG